MLWNDHVLLAPIKEVNYASYITANLRLSSFIPKFEEFDLVKSKINTR
jgi:hypothetical protein